MDKIEINVAACGRNKTAAQTERAAVLLQRMAYDIKALSLY